MNSSSSSSISNASRKRPASAEVIESQRAIQRRKTGTIVVYCVSVHVDHVSLFRANADFTVLLWLWWLDNSTKGLHGLSTYILQIVQS
jgi:hypothetical protein